MPILEVFANAFAWAIRTASAAVTVFLSAAASSTPYVNVWGWTTSGFTSKYSSPATIPTLTTEATAFTPSVDAVVYGDNATPYLFGYPWSASGFGTKYSNPTTLPVSATYDIDATDSAVAVSDASSPYVAAWPFSAVTGFGTKYSNPGTAVPNVGTAIKFSPAGTAIAVGYATTSPFFSAYTWSSGFGTRYTNPSSPGAQVSGIAFNPAGTVIAVAHQNPTGGTTTPCMSAYPWNPGFGTKYANPVTNSDGNGYGCEFATTGDAVAVANTGIYPIAAYPWNAGFGTKYAEPSSPISAGLDVTFTSGAIVGSGQALTASFYAWSWSSSTGFGSKFTDAASSAIGQVTNVEFSG